MALILPNYYPGRFNAPTAAYPHGSHKNRSTATSNDGSYYEQAWANDIQGFHSQLLSAAGITPSGVPDQVGASDLYNALKGLFLMRGNDLSDVANAATSLSKLGGLAKSNNLSDLASIPTALTNLGLLTNGSVGRLIGVRTFTSSATYIPTTGTTEIIVEVIGGGGGTGYCPGQGPSNFCTTGGGGGGSYAIGRYTSGFSSVAVTIGTGGAGGIVTSATGPYAGGTSSFGSLISCPGGNIGIAASATSSYLFFGSPGNGGALPTGSGIVYSAMGGPGGFGLYLGPTTLGGNGGANGKGGGGPIGSGITSAGVTATTPGAGGSGGSAGPSSGGANGGSGAPGIVVVYELA